MDRRSVFLTTVNECKNRLDIKYFISRDVNGDPVFTTGISVAEAGIKTVLSDTRIDEIVALGPKEYCSSDSEEGIKLSDIKIKNGADISAMSEYEFFCYRIVEYLNQVDFEMIDIDELVSEDVKKTLSEKVDTFRKAHSLGTPKGLFLEICSDKELESAFRDEVLTGLTEDESKWVCHQLYTQMDAYYKIHVGSTNRDAIIRYLPIDLSGELRVDDITKVARSVLGDDDHKVDLYMDMQGMGSINGNTLISTFLMTNKRTGYTCKIKGLISSGKKPSAVSGRVLDLRKSYDITKLMSGIDLFLEYGKDAQLKEFWSSLNVIDPNAERLFNAMDCIDEGVSLCIVDLISYGINIIRSLVKKLKDKHTDNIYLEIILNAIKADYGSLLEGDELSVPELLKWCLRKGFYQQLLTIIESKVPYDIVKRGIYYYARDSKDIDAFRQELNVMYWNQLPTMRWSYNDIEHYFIKFYGRHVVDFRQSKDAVARDYAKLRVDALHGKVEGIVPAFSYLKDDALLYELLLSYYKIGNLRNAVNHAVIEENALEDGEEFEHKDNRILLGDAIGKFIKLYCSACEKAVPDKNVPQFLDADRFRSYAKKHELVPLTEDKPGVLDNSFCCSYNGKEVLINIRMLAPEQDED